MKLTSAAGFTLIAAIMSISCNNNSKTLYHSDRYVIFPDRVEQGDHTSAAISNVEMVSDYKSANTSVEPVIEFKFSINGRDNELPFGVNHQANIYPDDESGKVLDIIFGARSVNGTLPRSGESLPPNTRVRFRADFSQVLESFRTKGFFDDIAGNRIFKEDFNGLYIAGDTYPLSWDFENIPSNPMFRMEDPDGDGIFEKELIFNVHDPSAHTSANWKLTNDISEFPVFGSSFPLLNALHSMSLDELVMLMEEDGTFRTGKEWAGVWTRDISYATMLSLAYLDPERCITSLMQKVSDKRIIQDTGTGGAWPVSSDRVVWVIAAWEIYKYTGDKEWLEEAFQIAITSLKADSKTIPDLSTGLIRGESSFLDWRKQTYPTWMEPADIYGSLNLGTNAAYCQALKVAGKMAQELGEEDTFSSRAEELRKNINEKMWLDDNGYFGQYLYGRYFISVSPRAEALGEAFTVLFDIAEEERKIKVLQNTPVTPFGITCIYPQIPGIPPYHNNGIWPFVQAFWTLANAELKQGEAVQAGLASIIRPAALFLTNKENFVAETGDFAGTEINSDRQLWSVAAMLAVMHRTLIGLNFTERHMKFNPVIPESFCDEYSLSGLKYRNGIYNITVKGWGDEISVFRIDGAESTDHFIPATMTGTHAIEIVMNGKRDGKGYNSVSNYTAPETPGLEINGNRLSWTRVEGAKEYMVFRNGLMISSTTETASVIENPEESAVYQVLAADSAGFRSFLSNPVTMISLNRTVTVEAEDFSMQGESSVPGFYGSGYIRFALDNNSESARGGEADPDTDHHPNTESRSKNELDIKINARAGRYALRLRYANGTGPVNTDNNCAIRSLYVNGIYALALVFPQRGKDEWSDWGDTFPEWIELKEGENILTIKYESHNMNMDGKINEFLLDRIIIEKFD